MDAYKRDLQVSRRGRVPTWFALLLGAGALFAGVELLDERQSAEGYSRVDTARAKILCDESEPCAPGEWSGRFNLLGCIVLVVGVVGGG